MKEFDAGARPGMKAARFKAIIYCRAASAAASDLDAAMLAQEIRCRTYAADKGYSVEKVIYDCPASGTKFDRPGTRELVQYLAREKASGRYVVVVDDMARIGRNIEAREAFLRALAKAGAGLAYPDAGIGPECVQWRAQAVFMPEGMRGPKR